MEAPIAQTRLAAPELAIPATPARRVELPTLLLLAACYGAWLSLTWLAARAPWWAVVVPGAYVIALHGSLQHEAVHRHPTRSRRWNAFLVGLPLALWLPYRAYFTSHLRHHAANLTSPASDPESFFVTQRAWTRMGAPSRAVAWAMMTLAGRLALGPVVVVWQFLTRDARRVPAREWLVHLLGVALVLGWVHGVCGLSLWAYVAIFVYPGTALSLLRSYAEHHPATDRAHRTAIVEAAPFFGLVFLHNNLHALHHREPKVPWYALPGRYRALREELLAENGGYHFRGYGELARRFAFVPRASPVHPSADED